MVKSVELGELISPANTVRCGDCSYPVLSMTMHKGLVLQSEKFNKIIASKDTSDYKVVYRSQLVISFPIDEGVLATQRITDAGIVSPAYGIWDIDKELVLPEYLEYALRSNRAIQYYKAKLRGSTARRRSLPTPTLLSFQIQLPSLEEQYGILDKVHRVKEIVRLREAQLKKLETLTKSRFVEMFGDEKYVTRLDKYIVELRGGKSLAGNEPCINKVLKTGAATFGRFDPNQYKYLPVDYNPLPEHKVETGDVIISRMNTPELVGACSYVFEAPENMYYPDRLWKAVLTKDCNPIFIWQLLWDKEVRRQIKEKSGGTSGTMHNISKANLLAIACPDIPKSRQDQFASFVEQVDKSRSKLKNHVDKSMVC